jgi:hypothetical protein
MKCPPREAWTRAQDASLVLANACFLDGGYLIRTDELRFTKRTRSHWQAHIDRTDE